MTKTKFSIGDIYEKIYHIYAMSEYSYVLSCMR